MLVLSPEAFLFLFLLWPQTQVRLWFISMLETPATSSTAQPLNGSNRLDQQEFRRDYFRLAVARRQCVTF